MMFDMLMIVIELLIGIVLFSVLVQVSKYVLDKMTSSTFIRTSRLLDPHEYFPEEELSTIKQIFYLIIIVLIVVDILYSVVGWQANIIIFSVFDVLLSLHFAIHVSGALQKINSCCSG